MRRAGDSGRKRIPHPRTKNGILQELTSRTAPDINLRQGIPARNPLKSDSQWYLLLEWSSSRPRQDGSEGMSEKMEAFLADQLEIDRLTDAVIAQTVQQSRNMWRIR